MAMIHNVLRNLVSPSATRRYPEVKRPPVPGYRGPVQIDASRCILCGTCMRRCSSQCIQVDVKEATWTIDEAACVYCAVCVEVCPVKCLSMENHHPAPESETAPFVAHATGKRKKE